MTNVDRIQERPARAISIGQRSALLAHVAIFGFVAYLLFRPGASTHFAVAPKG
jgi:hypothetical protein